MHLSSCLSVGICTHLAYVCIFVRVYILIFVRLTYGFHCVHRLISIDYNCNDKGKKLVEQTAAKAEAGLLNTSNDSDNDMCITSTTTNTTYSSSSWTASPNDLISSQSAVDADHGNDFNSTFLLRLYKKLKQSMNVSTASSSASLSSYGDQDTERSQHTYIDNVMMNLKSISSSSHEGDNDEALQAQEAQQQLDKGYHTQQRNVRTQRTSECPICLEDKRVSLLSITTCGHIVCTACVDECLSATKRCMNCSRELCIETDITSLRHLENNTYDEYEKKSNVFDDDCRINTSKHECSHQNYRKWGDTLHRGHLYIYIYTDYMCTYPHAYMMFCNLTSIIYFQN